MARCRKKLFELILKMAGKVFRILVLNKIENFHARTFLIFTGSYDIYFPCIKNKYWLFVI